jgi:hypothetical protein
VRKIIADTDFVGSAWLVAVMVTVCCAEIVAGAVYRSDALSVPVPAGLIVQVTAVLLLFATRAVNCCFWPPLNVATVGVKLIETGASVSVAVADLVGSAWLVAVIITVC